MNELFDGDGYAHRLTDNPKGGGGKLIVPTAELSLIGTTTRDRFQATMTPHLLAIGWLSRFLLLPLPKVDFIWEEAEQHCVNLSALRAQRETLYPDLTFWLPEGEIFTTLLAPDAGTYFKELRAYFEPLFTENHPAFSRHQIHFQKIAGLLAWYRIGLAKKAGRESAAVITLDELRAAEAVMRAVEPFARGLLDTSVATDPATPQWKRFEYQQIEKVRDTLQRIQIPLHAKGLFASLRRHIPKCSELTEILTELARNGEVTVLPTKKGSIYWLTSRPYPTQLGATQ
jgi:hypothetical protein